MARAKKQIRSYILTLKWNGWQKRLFLSGENSERTQDALREAFADINKIGDKAKDWLQFLSRANRALERRGFTRIDA